MPRTRFNARHLVAVAALLLFSAGEFACTLGSGQSRVRDGHLYVTGTAAYDAYFRDVHALQGAASRWSENKRAARKPLCDELKVAVDAPDATVAQLTHERMVEIAGAAGPLSLELVGDDARMVAANGAKNVPASARPLFRAVEITARAELERAHRLIASSTKIDQTVRIARELEPRVSADFTGRGLGKATEVRSEIAASLDVLTPFAAQSRGLAQGAEDFVLDVKRAIVTASALPASPMASPGKGPGKSGGAPAPSAKAPAKEPTSKPAPSVAVAAQTPAQTPAPVAVTPPSAPPPEKKPAKPEEVFNP